MRFRIAACLIVMAAAACAQPYPGAATFVRNLGGLEIRALVTAQDGSIWVGGVAKSAGLPVTSNAIQAELNPSICGVIPGPGLVPNPCGDAYFARFDRNGAVEYGSYLGGAGADELDGIAVGPNGDVFVLGLSRSTEIAAGRGPFVLQLRADGSRGFVRSLSPDPDVTPIAIVASRDAVYVAGHSAGDAFLTKLDAASGAVSFTKSFGGSASETVAALALDGAGNAYVTGETRSSDYPVTPGAWHAVAPATPLQSSIFVTQVAAAGDRTLASAVFGGESNDFVERIAVAPNGDVVLGGTTGSRQFPVTHGAMQSEVFAGNTGWVVRLRGDLSAPILSTLLDAYTNVAGIAPLADGSTVLFGNTQSNFFPVTADAIERCPATAYVARLAPDGSRFLYASFLALPNDERRLLHAEVTESAITFAGAASISVVGNSATRPAAQLCAVNSASFGNFLTYGGEYVTIFGGGLNPEQVLVNETPAELLYVSPGQVNILVPPLAAAKMLRIEVEGTGTIDAPAVERAPGLFRVYGTYGAAALNDDGSMNGPNHPARRGGGLTFFGTGFGPAPGVRVQLDQTEAPVRTVVDDRGMVRIEVTVPDLPAGRYPVYFQTEVGFQAGFFEITMN